MALTTNKMVRAAGANAVKSDISFHDENDMASDDAAGVASQQSIKAYVDTEVASAVATRTAIIQVLGASDSLATGDGFASGDAYWTIPLELNGWNLTDADAMVYTASTSGTPTFQIHNLTDTADMLSTEITIDENEKTSYTAAAAPVIDTGADDVATGDVLRFDCDVAGTGTKGCEFHLVFTNP